MLSATVLAAILVSAAPGADSDLAGAQFTAQCLGVYSGDTLSVMRDGKPLMVEVPPHVVLTVKETEPGMRGDTAQGGNKPATLETGLTVNVPLFIEIGDTLKVDTRTGEYLGRAES